MDSSCSMFERNFKKINFSFSFTQKRKFEKEILVNNFGIIFGNNKIESNFKMKSTQGYILCEV